MARGDQNNTVELAQSKAATTSEKPPKLTQAQVVQEYFRVQPHSEDQQTRCKVIREAGNALAQAILVSTKQCADQTAAIRKVREATMTAVQAISLEELGK